MATLPGCRRPVAEGWHGYLEGEFVHVAAPMGGRLERLAVSRGARVERGATLFVLEHESEMAAQREAAERLRAAEARLADLKKGSRPTELAALEARLAQARTAAELSQRELTRQEALFQSAAIAANDLDRARLTHQRNTRAIEELVAQLATAGLGARSDAVAAAEAEVSAARAAMERADWAVGQRTQAAPREALVHDTLYREGEFVAVGAPVVALLPAENLKVRFFVGEPAVASLPPGTRVKVSWSNGGPPREARVSYVSPRPEYTPPVLYNRENRAKLVFMIEAQFVDATTARTLNPGLPVDVSR